MTDKTLYELSEEYSRCCQNTKAQIEDYRQQLRAARRNGQNFTVTDLTRKLTVLYDQLDELECTRNYLRNYYRKEIRYAG